MWRRNIFLVLSLSVILGLLASCAVPAPASTPKPPAAPGIEAPQTKPAAPTPTAKSVQQPKYGGTLLLANKNEPGHFDMHQDTSIGIQLPLAPCYSLVVQNDPQDEDKIIGDLAKSWEISANALTYTFRLHEGVKFHDGALLTAQDVKFNLDRIVFPPKGIISARKELFQAVEKIEATEPSTVKVTLKYPQPSFLQLLAMPFNFVFSPEVIEKKGNMKRDVVGTGPFKFSNYVDRISFSVKRNPDYFIKGRPYLDGVTTYIIFDERTRFAALRTKQIHMLPLSGEVTSTQATELRRSEPSLIIHERVNPGLTSIIPNTQVKPWSDVRVRQAVNLAIDREAGGKVVRGGYFPGYGYTMATGKWSLPEKELMSMPGFRKPKDQDLAEAKRLLAEAGYPEGFKSTLQTSTSITAKETAEFGKEQLARIGIMADVRIVDIVAFKQILFEGRFEVVSFNDASAVDDPDIVLGEYYLTGSPKNWGKWSNLKYDELYAQQSKTTDPQKRLELVQEMQRLLHREAPRAIVTWSRRFAVLWPQVKDWLPGKSLYLNHKFQDVWLER